MTITSYSFLFISLIMQKTKDSINLFGKKKKKLPNGTIFSIKFKLKSLI